MIISDALVQGNYRYWLSREWDPRRPRCTIIGLNPSTADAKKNDATIRKEMGFAVRWVCGSLYKLNLYPFRATKPRDLLLAKDKFGDAAAFIRAFDTIQKGELVVCAWGATRLEGDEMHRKGIMNILWSKGAVVRALGVTKDGSPKHPLYVPYDTDLVEFRG